MRAFFSSECRLINSNWVECLRPVSLLCTVGLLWADTGLEEKGDRGEKEKEERRGGDGEKMEDVCKSTSMTDSLNQISGYLFSITH